MEKNSSHILHHILNLQQKLVKTNLDTKLQVIWKKRFELIE